MKEKRLEVLQTLHKRKDAKLGSGYLRIDLEQPSSYIDPEVAEAADWD